MDLEEIGQVVCGCTKYFVWVSYDPKGAMFPVIAYVHVSVTPFLQDASGQLYKKKCDNLYPGLWSKIDDRIAETMGYNIDDMEENDDSKRTYH